MSVLVRSYQAGDRDSCLALFLSNVPRFFHAGEVQAFSDFLDANPDRYTVVLAGRAIVGCGGFLVSDDGRLASLCWGMVRSDRHRQGIGALLLRARLQAIAAGSAAQQVRLLTSQHTAGFYRRHGFAIRHTWVDGIAPGLDEVEMRLDMGSLRAE